MLTQLYLSCKICFIYYPSLTSRLGCGRSSRRCLAKRWLGRGVSTGGWRPRPSSQARQGWVASRQAGPQTGQSSRRVSNTALPNILPACKHVTFCCPVVVVDPVFVILISVLLRATVPIAKPRRRNSYSPFFYNQLGRVAELRLLRFVLCFFLILSSSITEDNRM